MRTALLSVCLMECCKFLWALITSAFSCRPLFPICVGIASPCADANANFRARMSHIARMMEKPQMHRSTKLNCESAKAQKKFWPKVVLLSCVTAALLLWNCHAYSQTSYSASDPQALALASRAIVALTGGQAIHDVILTGNITRDIGRSDDGSVTLRALGAGESRIDMELGKGARSKIRDDSQGIAQGKWINPDGRSGKIAFQNTLTDAVWFFPALGYLAGGQNVVFAYVGRETRNGVAVEHIRSYLAQTGNSGIPNLRNLSTVNFYLNVATLLPVAETFNTHPDGNDLVNLPVEVDFSNYHTIHGVAVPMHIQRRLQGHLVEDIVVTSASFNNGIPLSTFSVH